MAYRQMKIVVATQANRPFDGIFWKAYHDAGGPEPSAALYLSSAIRSSFWRRSVEALLLFRPWELLRVGTARVAGRPVGETDRDLGLHLTLEDIWDVPCHEIHSLNDEPGFGIFRALEPDILISVAAPEIFQPKVLDQVRLALNIHNGELPAFRGRFGTFWEMAENRNRGAVSVHVMSKRVDSGPVLRMPSIELSNSVFSNLARKKKVGGEVLAEVLKNPKMGLDGAYDEIAAHGEEEAEGYYGWPSLCDLIRWRWMQSS